MKYNSLDLLFDNKIEKLDCRMDLGEYSFEMAAQKLDLIDDDFTLYVPVSLYIEAIRIVSTYLALIDSNKKPKELIKLLKNAEADDWLVEKEGKITFSPGA